MRDISLYECQSLIFSHLSCIRHLVYNTSFGHMRRSLHYQFGRSRHEKKKKKERDPELNLVPHGPSNEVDWLRSTIYIRLVGCDWCISILTVLVRSCSLKASRISLSCSLILSCIDHMHIRLARTHTSAVSEHAHKTGHYPLWNEVKFF